ncbi:Hypothetical protein NocV09_01301340 [Nannochloropsis oceanica]
MAVSELLARGRGGKDVNSYCCKCGSPRADVRLQCCSNAVHARCIYPWPLIHCPSCGQNGADVAIEVALPDPFTRSGIVVQAPVEELSKMRGGRWSEAECKFAEMVMEGFLTGMLPLREGGRLGTFLCALLQCTPARLSSKLRTGKRNFKYQPGSNTTRDQIFQYEQQQRKLSQQEELFLHYLSSEEAAVASHSLQLEWRLQFVELAQQRGIHVNNLQEWGPLLRIASLSNCAGSGSTDGSSSSRNHALGLLPLSGGDETMMDTAATAADGMPSSLPSLPHRKRTTSSSSLAESYQGSMHQRSAPRQQTLSPPSSSSRPASPSPMRNIAPLMVRMAADRRRNFTVEHGVMAATTIEDLLRLLRQGPSPECAVLAGASNGTIFFVSAGMQRLLQWDHVDLLGSRLVDHGLGDSVGVGGTVRREAGGGGGLGLVHREDAELLSTVFRQTQQHVKNLVDRMGSPQLPIQERDLMLLPVVLRLRRRDNSFLPRQLTAFATDDFLLLHAPCPAASEPPQQVPYAQQQHKQQQQLEQQQEQEHRPLITASVSRAELEQDFGNLALTQRQQINSSSPSTSSSLPPHPRRPFYSPPQPSSSNVVQPAVLRLHNRECQSSSAEGGCTNPHLPLSMHYDTSGKANNVLVASGKCSSSSSSSHSSSSCGSSSIISRSSSSSTHSSGRASSPFPSTGMEVERPWEDEGMRDEKWVNTITVSSAKRGSVGGRNGNRVESDSYGMSVREGGSAWADSDGLEWAADEEISQALQALARAPSPPLENNACGGAYDLCYSPPTTFEETMRSFLQELPAQAFQCTDVWVPSRDPNSDRISLQFGGGVALRGSLSEWIFYSRNFAFYEGQGMPGRVFRNMACEYREDVASLDSTLFLRRDGAQMVGVHAYFGVPVVQDEMVFVLVFYSSHANSRYITHEVLEFIKHTVASWRVVFAPPSMPALAAAACSGGGGSNGAGGAVASPPREVPEYLS